MGMKVAKMMTLVAMPDNAYRAHTGASSISKPSTSICCMRASTWLSGGAVCRVASGVSRWHPAKTCSHARLQCPTEGSNFPVFEDEDYDPEASGTGDACS